MLTALHARDGEHRPISCLTLFWAVHGYSYHGECLRRDQIGAASLLIEAGTEVKTHNNQKVSTLDLLTDPSEEPMRKLLMKHGATGASEPS